MAALTNATRGNELTELIPADIISDIVLPADRSPDIGMGMAWAVQASRIGRGSTFNFGKFNAVDPTHTEASPKTEAEETGFGTLVKHETTETTATAVVVGLTSFLSEEGKQDAAQSHADMLSRMVEGMRKRVSLDILLNTPNASNSSDFSAEELNKSNWGTAHAAFFAQDIRLPGMWQAVAALDTGQMRDLRKAFRSDGASIEATGRALDLFGVTQGTQGMLEGVVLVSGNDVAENDGSNHSGAIMAVGNGSNGAHMNIGSALGFVNWWDESEEDVVGMFKLFAMRDAPNPTGWYYTVSARYGTTITNQTAIREIISQD